MTDHALHSRPIGPRVTLPYGEVIRDTYTVDAFLGAGRFADVYLVRHRFMGMQAMKVFVNDEREEDRLAGFNEAFLLSRITHPSIVRVFDANQLEPTYGQRTYVTMEYVEGGTLRAWMESQSCNLEGALEVAIQICDAVAHAHSMVPPIVHRDLKPENILIDSKGESPQVRVADFGLAAPISQLTETVESGGTILYLSPEGLDGYEVPASDVYSLGLVLFEMFAGCMPYRLKDIPEGASARQVKQSLAEWQHGHLEAPSYFNQKVPPDIDAVIQRCMTRDAGDRYRTAAHLKGALVLCRQSVRAEKERLASRGTAHGIDDGCRRAHHLLRLAFRIAITDRRVADGQDWLRQAIATAPQVASSYEHYLAVWQAETEGVAP